MSPSAPNPTEKRRGFGARQGGATPLWGQRREKGCCAMGLASL